MHARSASASNHSASRTAGVKAFCLALAQEAGHRFKSSRLTRSSRRHDEQSRTISIRSSGGGTLRVPHGALNSSSAMRYVTIEKASDLTGYTPDAIRSKIKRGDWLEGAVWHRAPDGRVLIDLQGYDKWVEGSLQHLACALRPHGRSRSTSTIAESAAESD